VAVPPPRSGGRFDGSLSLFVSAVYSDDPLGTPVCFVTDGSRPRLFWRLPYERRDADSPGVPNTPEDPPGDDEEHRGRVADVEEFTGMRGPPGPD
jgi:hypothetical protein